MYLYYLLGWRLNAKYFTKFEEGEDENTLREKLEVRDWQQRTA